MGTKTVIRPANAWVTRGRRWSLTDRPLLMGILNVTPDSFSDGGQFLGPERAIARGHEMVAQGADLIDVGGESTRPGAEPVPAAEEIRRTEPVVTALAEEGITVSIDTTKSEVAREALAAGAAVINDISAGVFDAGLPEAAAEFGAGYVAMHMQGRPQTMQQNPRYTDVVGEVLSFLEERAEALESAGMVREAIALDPGIGFGKTAGHNLTLLAHVHRLVELGRPVVVGCSRKSLIGQLTGAPVDGRLPGSLAAHLWAWQRGVQVLRVHDVAETTQALAMWQAITADPPAPPAGQDGGAEL